MGGSGISGGGGPKGESATKEIIKLKRNIVIGGGGGPTGKPKKKTIAAKIKKRIKRLIKRYK